LYPLLGDREKQNEVREKHRDVRHCPILANDPSGCIGCENNPYENEELAGGEYLPIIHEAYRLHDLVELGLLSQLGIVETELVRAVHQSILIDRMKAQAALIAQRLMGTK